MAVGTGLSAAGLAERVRRIERRVAPAPWPEHAYTPRGAAARLFAARDREVLIAGPAGTGKSRAALEYLHDQLQRYPGARALLVRKTRESLSESGLYTWEEHVLGPDHPLRRGPERRYRQSYRYPNGSLLVAGGVDKSSRYMSSEWDLVLCQEATELEEREYEDLLSRLRHGATPRQQLLADANPGPPTHWLKQRADRGDLVLLESRHEDNPLLWDAERGDWTPAGRAYMAVLDKLTGVRYLRLRRGVWAAAEGLVYEAWDPARHLADPGDLPRTFKRVVAGVDWGYTNPGVILVLAEDGDGGLWVVRQVYRAGRTLDWWTELAACLRTEYGIGAFLCDPGQPGHIEAFRRAGLPARRADNDVRLGLQRVSERLAAGRLRIVRGSNRDSDGALREAGSPTGAEDEITAYVWADGKEQPVKLDDHAMDALRYGVMGIDGRREPEAAATSRSYGT